MGKFFLLAARAWSLWRSPRPCSTRIWTRTLAAAGSPEGRVYLLHAESPDGIAEIEEYDHHFRLDWVIRNQLPAGFHPQRIGVSSSQIYLVNANGKVPVYPIAAGAKVRLTAIRKC